jgi:hypothetical protein
MIGIGRTFEEIQVHRSINRHYRWTRNFGWASATVQRAMVTTGKKLYQAEIFAEL